MSLWPTSTGCRNRFAYRPERGAWCLACHDYHSLGPSRDDGEHAEAVGIEIRAAGIAADWRENGESSQKQDGWQFGWWLYGDEVRGDGISGLADGTDYNAAYLSFYPGWLAGWLARTIVDHEEDSNG